jgi:hypothetical protein
LSCTINISVHLTTSLCASLSSPFIPLPGHYCPSHYLPYPGTITLPHSPLSGHYCSFTTPLIQAFLPPLFLSGYYSPHYSSIRALLPFINPLSEHYCSLFITIPFWALPPFLLSSFRAFARLPGYYHSLLLHHFSLFDFIPVPWDYLPVIVDHTPTSHLCLYQWLMCSELHFVTPLQVSYGCISIILIMSFNC